MGRNRNRDARWNRRQSEKIVDIPPPVHNPKTNSLQPGPASAEFRPCPPPLTKKQKDEINSAFSNAKKVLKKKAGWSSIQRSSSPAKRPIVYFANSDEMGFTPHSR